MNILNAEGVKLEAIYAAVPPNAVDNVESLRAIYGDKAEGIVKATGIKRRRIAASGTTGLDLCLAAAQRLFADTGARPEDFGAVICVSFTQQSRMPCSAVQAQDRLGLPKGVIAFDVMLACSGWGYGLYLAALLARQTGKKTLLLDGDVQSAFMDAADAATVPVLADAGTATVVAPCADARPWRFSFMADGGKGAALTLERGGTIKMDGFGVFRFVSMDVTGFIREFMAKAPLDVGAVDAFVPHQANVYMIKLLAKGLGFAPEKLKISGDELGNSASATVPVTLAWNKTVGRVLFSGFGGGLSACVGEIQIGEECKYGIVS